METKRLYRNTDDKIVAGVLSGVADYFKMDPTLVRLGFAVLMVATKIIPFAILYLLAAVIIPEKPKAPNSGNGKASDSQSDHQTAQ